MAETQVVERKRTSDDRTEATRPVRQYIPAVDIVEAAKELTLHADMPGLNVENIDIDFDNGELTITGKVEQRQNADVRFIHCEYGIGDFRRTFRVSENIDAGKINAEYRNGVLIVHLPKIEAAQPRKIAVSAKS